MEYFGTNSTEVRAQVRNKRSNREEEQTSSINSLIIGWTNARHRSACVPSNDASEVKQKCPGGRSLGKGCSLLNAQWQTSSVQPRASSRTTDAATN
jgi:hypothetical protein